MKWILQGKGDGKDCALRWKSKSAFDIIGNIKVGNTKYRRNI